MCIVLGVRNLIQPEFIKQGACLIDVGLIRITDEEGKEKLVGDIDYEGTNNYYDLQLYKCYISNLS